MLNRRPGVGIILFKDYFMNLRSVECDLMQSCDELLIGTFYSLDFQLNGECGFIVGRQISDNR